MSSRTRRPAVSSSVSGVVGPITVVVNGRTSLADTFIAVDSSLINSREPVTRSLTRPAAPVSSSVTGPALGRDGGGIVAKDLDSIVVVGDEARGGGGAI